MKVSIVIPAYNEEKFITNTLKAVLEQNYSDYEVIVVDNCSTDTTQDIARSFPVKVVSENRKGTMWACERGRREASGEIIVRMDADCLPDKRWLARGMKYFNNKNVVAVTGPYYYFDANLIFRNLSLIMQNYIYRPINSIFQYYKIGAIMIGGNSFIRSDVLDKIGGFKTSIIFYGDDTDTAKRLAKHGVVVFDKDLIMKTSARRFRSEGFIKLTLRYFFHFFKVIFQRS